MKILVVDDNPEIRILIRNYLKRKQFEVETASSGNEAANILKNQAFSCVISDISMADGDGITFTKDQRAIGNQIPIFLISGELNMTSEIAIAAGATAFFPKPVNFKTLLDAVASASKISA